MKDHLVEQSESNMAVVLTCHDCDWFLRIGYHNGMDADSRRDIQPLVTLIKWAHQDPGLIKNDTADEMVERSTWRRVRDYILKGTP